MRTLSMSLLKSLRKRRARDHEHERKRRDVQEASRSARAHRTTMTHPPTSIFVSPQHSGTPTASAFAGLETPCTPPRASTPTSLITPTSARTLSPWASSTEDSPPHVLRRAPASSPLSRVPLRSPRRYAPRPALFRGLAWNADRSLVQSEREKDERVLARVASRSVSGYAPASASVSMAQSACGSASFAASAIGDVSTFEGNDDFGLEYPDDSTAGHSDATHVQTHRTRDSMALSMYSHLTLPYDNSLETIDAAIDSVVEKDTSYASAFTLPVPAEVPVPAVPVAARKPSSHALSAEVRRVSGAAHRGGPPLNVDRTAMDRLDGLGGPVRRSARLSSRPRIPSTITTVTTRTASGCSSTSTASASSTGSVSLLVHELQCASAPVPAIVAVRALEDEVTALRASQRRHELAADLHAKERARLTCEIETLGAEAVRLRRDRNAAEREAEGAREKLRTAQRKAYELGEEVVRLRGGTMRGQPVRDLLRLEDE